MKFTSTAGAGMALVLTVQFAQAAAPDRQDRALETRQTIHAVCASDAPALVVDTFALPEKTLSGYARGEPSTDLDGDGIPEISHGDLVAAVLETTGKTYIPYNIPERVTAGHSINIFLDIADKIAGGHIPKPSYINYSSGVFYDLRRLNRLVPDLTLTPENIGSYRKEILAGLLENDPDRHNYRLLHEAMSKLEAMGVTTVTATGNNFSPAMANIMSFMPGTVTGSALERDGITPAPYANTNSSADYHRKGEVFAREVSGGIDIDGDDIPEFRAVSGDRKIIAEYEGKKPEDILRTIPAYLQAHKKFPDLLRAAMQRRPPEEGIYRSQDIYELFYAYPLTAQHQRDMQNYGEYIHYPTLTPFRKKADGTLDYDPAGNGDPAIVSDFRGTSYIPPRLCDLQEGP